jgi:8-oxo-dGTP diphosphatase
MPSADAWWTTTRALIPNSDFRLRRAARVLGPSRPVVRIGVQAVIRDGDQILLGRRANTFGRGTWGLPGGHIEPGEKVLAAAAREVREETGLEVGKMRIACITDPQATANHHMQIGVEVLEYAGEIRILEPERCERWQFWPIGALPADLFVASVEVLRRIEANDLYDYGAFSEPDPETAPVGARFRD